MTPAGGDARFGCRDVCGRRATEEEAMQSAWTWLSISGAWRCPDCHRALVAAAGIDGVPQADFVDPLPSSSRGALAKETASSIAAPTVRP